MQRNSALSIDFIDNLDVDARHASEWQNREKSKFGNKHFIDRCRERHLNPKPCDETGAVLDNTPATKLLSDKEYSSLQKKYPYAGVSYGYGPFWIGLKLTCSAPRSLAFWILRISEMVQSELSCEVDGKNYYLFFRRFGDIPSGLSSSLIDGVQLTILSHGDIFFDDPKAVVWANLHPSVVKPSLVETISLPEILNLFSEFNKTARGLNRYKDPWENFGSVEAPKFKEVK
jgi:hypothetical protein